MFKYWVSIKPLPLKLELEKLSDKESVIREKRSSRREMKLVEFWAPKELVEALDSSLSPRFSNRSEAIRYLIWTFLEESGRS